MARILVVDDEAPIRRMLRTTLELAGHEVIEASHGKEALIRFRESSPDLVITDIVMPEMDGLEVIMQLRREAPNLKVIAMSGGGRFGMTEALHMAEPLGALATVRKPFDLDAMLEIVSKAVAA